MDKQVRREGDVTRVGCETKLSHCQPELASRVVAAKQVSQPTLDVTFKMIKNIIITENKELLRIIAKFYALDHNELEQKYLRPAYYLPIVTKLPTPPK
jgi:hypothetical protein